MPGVVTRLEARLFGSRPAWLIARWWVAVHAFALGYLLVRLPAFWAVARRDRASFEPVGVLWWLPGPLPAAVWRLLILALLAAGVGAVAAARARRWLGPVVLALFVVVTTYRSSWGQLLWFENLLVVHLAIAAPAPVGGVALRRHDARCPGWPLGLAATATVVTYVLAGVAKLRAGGAAWIDGDTLAHHIGWSAARLRVLGGAPSPVAGWVLDARWALGAGALVTVVAELAAPLALVGRRAAAVWVTVMWSFHALIAVTMLVVFPYPLLGLAFLPVWWCAADPVATRPPDPTGPAAPDPTGPPQA